MSKSKNKKIYIEVMRIIAAIMVLYIHSKIARSYNGDSYSFIQRIIVIQASILVRIAVPIFMMISGALLLCRTENKTSYIKKIFRALLIIFLICIVYCIIHINDNVNTINVFFNFFNLDNRLSEVYWYLYWWLSFIILLPIYQKFAKSLSDNEYQFLFLLFMIFRIALPILNFIAQHYGYKGIELSSSFDLHILTDIFIFPFAGYYVENRINDDRIKEIPALVLMLICVLSLLIEIMMAFAYKYKSGGYEIHCYLNPVIVVAFYMLVKRLFIDYDYKNNENITKVILFFSEQTLGVYAFSILIPDDWVEFYKGLFSPYFNSFIVKTINFVSRYLFLTIAIYVFKKAWAVLLDLIKSIKYNL